MDRRRKITWVVNTKVDFSVFCFVDVWFFFYIHFLTLLTPQIYHCREIMRCKARLAESVRVAGVDFSTPSEWMDFFLGVSLSRRLRNPEGIACRVPGVWVLCFPTYFNCCKFFLNTPNFKSPSGNQLIFMSMNGNSLFVTIWTLYSFTGVGEFSSFLHISAVNFRCWFPAALFTVCWNSSSQYLGSFALFFPAKWWHRTPSSSLVWL